VTRIIRRTALLLTLAAGVAVAAASPALASGQAYPAPGFPSANASCTGSGYDFSAHYGANGEFTRTLAQTSGPILVCVP
jgi:hypothetical protein